MEIDLEEAKISLQYSVWEICSTVAEREGVEFSYEFINNLATSAFELTGSVSGVLEYFAKHAKRHVITVDDIKLYFRSSPSLIKFIEESSESRHKAEKKPGEDKLNDERSGNHASSVESQDKTSYSERNASKKNENVKSAPETRKRKVQKVAKVKDSEVDSSLGDNDGALKSPHKAKSIAKSMKKGTCMTTRLQSKSSEAMETACDVNGSSYTLKPQECTTSHKSVPRSKENPDLKETQSFGTTRKPRSTQFKGSYKPQECTTSHKSVPRSKEKPDEKETQKALFFGTTRKPRSTQFQGSYKTN